MKKIARIDKHPLTGIILAAALFAAVLWLNFLTPLLVDDFVYMRSFADSSPITSLLQIPRSMYFHCFSMNGRLISHTLAQISLLFPIPLFKIVNAAVFVFTAALTCLIAQKRSAPFSAAGLFAVCAALWCFTPDFGEVMLWQVGAINYLWALTVMLLFIAPYIRRFQGMDLLQKRVWRILFCIFGFFAGFYSEVPSCAAIGIAVFLLFLSHFFAEKPLKTWLWIPVAAAICGYLCMMFLPAEIAAKQGDMTLAAMLTQCGEIAAEIFPRVWPLLLLFAVGALCSAMQKERERLLLSAVFFLASFGSFFVLCTAVYVAKRCYCTGVLLLILADLTLFAGVKDFCRRGINLISVVSLLCLCLLCVPIGVRDIAQAKRAFDAREAYIAAQKEIGKTDLVLPRITCTTEYCAIFDLQELSPYGPDDWPNRDMAKYYGLNSITMQNR